MFSHWFVWYQIRQLWSSNMCRLLIVKLDKSIQSINNLNNHRLYIVLPKNRSCSTYRGSICNKISSVFFFSSLSWSVLSSTNASRLLAYFSIIDIILSRILGFLKKVEKRVHKTFVILDTLKLTFVLSTDMLQFTSFHNQILNYVLQWWTVCSLSCWFIWVSTIYKTTKQQHGHVYAIVSSVSNLVLRTVVKY